MLGIVGMLVVQFALVAAINESNAVLFTLLQFLEPIFIVAFVSLSLNKWPLKYQVIRIIVTLKGLFLLLTNVVFEALLISKKVLLWGELLIHIVSCTSDERMEFTS
ncbi:EamA family transporter [Lysinibacillus xylanilyticus]|uniref:EamA family transporter n=1 Tax=Lysinibacillus xylanilyticus TaxID=582475 RepID=UPI003D0798AC